MAGFHESRFSISRLNKGQYEYPSPEAQRRAEEIVATMKGRAVHIKADQIQKLLQNPNFHSKTVRG